MLGHRIVAEYMAGPKITGENADQVVKEGEILVGQPEARTGAFYLNRYSVYGIEVAKKREKDAVDYFFPWGNILSIYGHQRDDLLRSIREAAEQDQTEESSESSPM